MQLSFLVILLGNNMELWCLSNKLTPNLHQMHALIGSNSSLFVFTLAVCVTCLCPVTALVIPSGKNTQQFSTGQIMRDEMSDTDTK